MRSFIGPGPRRLLGRIAGIFRSSGIGPTYLAVICSIIVIAIVDSLAPLDLSLHVWLLYYVPLVLSFALFESIVPIGVAFAATLLIIVAAFVSPVSDNLRHEVLSRGIGVLGLWITAIAGYFLVRNKLRLRGANEALQTELIERKQAEQNLQLSRARLRFALNAAQLGWWQFDPQSRVSSWDTRFKEIFGIAKDEAPIEQLVELMHPDDKERVWTAIEASLDPTSLKPSEVEHRLLRDGEVRWVEVHWLAYFEGTEDKRRAVRVVGTIQDITERKEHEEKEHLLMREINHRAKNMLNVVDAIARQTATKNPDDFIERFSDRIQALSASQDLLIQNRWQGVEIEDLVRAQLAHFADLIGSRIAIQGPKLRLKAAGAQAVGLALHELATNAGKYGALSGDTGRVDVRWVDGETFTISWTEREGPPVSAPESRGFGTVVTKAMAEQSMNGTVLLDYAPSGVTWRLTCPPASALEPSGL